MLAVAAATGFSCGLGELAISSLVGSLLPIDRLLGAEAGGKRNGFNRFDNDPRPSQDRSPDTFRQPDSGSQSENRSPTQSPRTDNSDSNDKNGNDKTSGGDAKGRQTVRQDDGNDNGGLAQPPNTISEWFGRLNSGARHKESVKPPVPAPAPVLAAPTTKAVQAVRPPNTPVIPPARATKPAPATTVAKKPAARTPQPAPLNPLPVGTLARDVLAVNPTPAVIARARSLGFTVQAAVDLPQLNMSVRRLVPPPGLEGVDARDFLGQQIGNGSFAVNQVYRPYRTADGKEASGGVPAAQPSGPAGCRADHCYGIAAIGWKQELRPCTQAVRIGIVDTMVDRSHPALRSGFEDNRIQSETFAGNGRRPATSGHGTSVLSLLAGAPQSGTPGLMPDATFLVADIFHADANNQPYADSLSLLRALDWLDRAHVKIVNMSVAGPHDDLMQEAIEKLSRAGMIFIAAAGNEGPAAAPVYPAAYAPVIAITAVSKELRGYRQANRGEYIDAAAPGVDVWTAVPGAQESYQSGTSFAAPFATAVVAAIYGQVKVKTKEGILAALEYRDLGLPGRDPVYGRGLMLAPKSCNSPPPSVAGRPEATTVSASPAGIGNATFSLGFAPGK